MYIQMCFLLVQPFQTVFLEMNTKIDIRVCAGAEKKWEQVKSQTHCVTHSNFQYMYLFFYQTELRAMHHSIQLFACVRAFKSSFFASKKMTLRMKREKIAGDTPLQMLQQHNTQALYSSVSFLVLILFLSFSVCFVIFKHKKNTRPFILMTAAAAFHAPARKVSFFMMEMELYTNYKWQLLPRVETKWKRFNFSNRQTKRMEWSKANK